MSVFASVAQAASVGGVVGGVENTRRRARNTTNRTHLRSSRVVRRLVRGGRRLVGRPLGRGAKVARERRLLLHFFRVFKQGGAQKAGLPPAPPDACLSKAVAECEVGAGGASGVSLSVTARKEGASPRLKNVSKTQTCCFRARGGCRFFVSRQTMCVTMRSMWLESECRELSSSRGPLKHNRLSRAGRLSEQRRGRRRHHADDVRREKKTPTRAQKPLMTLLSRTAHRSALITTTASPRPDQIAHSHPPPSSTRSSWSSSSSSRPLHAAPPRGHGDPP